MPTLVRREDTPAPVAPAPRARSTCSGWSCLSDAEQFGVLFSVVVTVTILGVIFICYMRNRRAQRDWGVELFQVRLPRELRRGRVTPVPVMIPPPAYQAVQTPYGQYSQPGLHIQAPPGATVQPYVAGPGGVTSVVYGQVDSHQQPAALARQVPGPGYYVPQQPISQTPTGAAPFYGQQPGIYGQDPGPGSWHAANIGHMSAAPHSAEPSKPKLRQRLMRMFRLPQGHASTVTDSPPSPRGVPRAATPYPTSASRRSSPTRPSRRPTRIVRPEYRRSARTVSPRPRRSMHSYRYASPRPRPRSQSPYVYRKDARFRYSPDSSSSSSRTSTSSSGSWSSTEAVVRGRSRASDRT